MEPVAITGLGVISSIGQDVETFCDNLMAAKAAVGPTPWNNEEGMENVWISLVDGFEPLDWMDERVAAGTDPFAQYMIAAAVARETERTWRDNAEVAGIELRNFQELYGRLYAQVRGTPPPVGITGEVAPGDSHED